jgi:hypothetical protein
MEPTSRRQFLKRSSAVAAAAGVAAAVPGGAAHALTKSATDAPPLPDDDSVDTPVVARVRDARKGLVSLYVGEREINIKNRRLAALLFHATR